MRAGRDAAVVALFALFSALALREFLAAYGHPAAIAYLERFGQRTGCRFLLARAKVSACCQTKTIPEALAAQP